MHDVVRGQGTMTTYNAVKSFLGWLWLLELVGLVAPVTDCYRSSKHCATIIDLDLYQLLVYQAVS